METVISPENTTAILTMIVGVVALGMWMEKSPKLGQYGGISIIVACAVLSAVGFLPRSSPFYDMVNRFFVPLSIPLLLFQANLRVIWRESGRVFSAFMIACAGTVLGAVIALQFIDLGQDNNIEFAGALTAGYTGGSQNMAAVADSFGFIDTPEMGVLVASAYAIVVPYLAFLLILPSLGPLWRLFGAPGIEQEQTQSQSNGEDTATRPTALSLTAALTVSAVIVWIGELGANQVNYPPLKYIIITLLSLFLATAAPGSSRAFSGHYEIGRIMLYCFLGVIGVGIEFSLAIEQGSRLIAFSLVIIAVHVTLLASLGRLFKLTAPELAIASNACILGASTAPAMALSKGWHSLITPGILTGVLGYALGSLLGIGLVELMTVL